MAIRSGLGCRIAGDAALLCYIEIHKDKVAYASGHDKQVKDFMGAKVPVFCVKAGKFECVDYASCCIEDTTGKKP